MRRLCSTRYLRDLWGHASDFEQRVVLLYEWIGAALMGLTTKYKTHLLLVGPPNTGKSQLVELVSALFPIAARSAIPLQKMGTQFGLMGLIGRRLNAVNELPPQRMSAGLEIAKAVMSGEPVDVDRKYLSPIVRHFRAGHIIAANTLPPGTDEALRKRVVILDCPHRIADDRKDVNLLAKLVQERSGIAMRALNGLSDLQRRGTYNEPRTHRGLRLRWEWAGSPVSYWAGSWLEHDPNGWIRTFDLYRHFKAFAETNCLPERELIPFGRDLAAWGAQPHNKGRSGRGFRVSFAEGRD